jgi:hypothetical protein
MALGVEVVYNTLQAALQNGPHRADAERQLKAWEEESAPGFIGDLLKVAVEVQNVSEVRSWIADRAPRQPARHCTPVIPHPDRLNWLLGRSPARPPPVPGAGVSAAGDRGGQECGGQLLAQDRGQQGVVESAG